MKQHQRIVCPTNNETNYLLLMRPFKKQLALSVQFLWPYYHLLSPPCFYLFAVSGRKTNLMVVMLIITILGLLLMTEDLPWFICFLPFSLSISFSFFYPLLDEHLFKNKNCIIHEYLRWSRVG